MCTFSNQSDCQICLHHALIRLNSDYGSKIFFFLVLLEFSLKHTVLLFTYFSFHDNKGRAVKCCSYIRTGRFASYLISTLPHIVKDYWANIKLCETWNGFCNLKTLAGGMKCDRHPYKAEIIYLFIYQYFYLSTYLAISIYLCNYLSIFPYYICIHLSIYLST